MTTYAMTDESHPSIYAQNLLQSMLLPGENIVHIATISPGIYWRGLAVGAAGLVSLLFGLWLAVYLLAVSAAMLLLAYSTERFLVLATTDHRVIVRAGILNEQVIQLRYRQLESVDVLKTVPGMFLGYGNVILTGTGMTRVIVPYVSDAIAFRDHLTQKLLERENPIPTQPEGAAKTA